MDIDILKSKLRQLKKVEKRIRFSDAYFEEKHINKLVWDSFFCTKDINEKNVRYCISRLMEMEKAEIKTVIDEYFFYIYYQLYKETGLSFKNVRDPDMLKLLGLDPYSSISDIKKRFRELAKIYHPDLGGEREKMIELLDVYNQLIE